MNFLAHALLAASPPESRLGGLIGDFVKGPLDSAANAHLPSAVRDGVALHRKIDSFADAHPAFRRSRARVSAGRRRYAGVMVDMFYDHLLAVQWADHCHQPLVEFAADCYALLALHHALLPARLQMLRGRMEADDWLAGYRDIARIHRALDGMARHRVARANPLAGAAIELEADYAGFEVDFLAFFPAAMDFVKVSPGGTAPAVLHASAMPPPA